MDHNIQECASEDSDKIVGATCEPCLRRRNKSELATLFCNTCAVYLCEECSDVHKVHTTGHNVVAVNKASVKPKVDIKGLDQCSEHKRVFMFHCEDHKDLCCEICAFSRHRRCENIHEIAMVAKHSKDDERENIRASIIAAIEVIMKCKDDQMNNASIAEEMVKEVDVFMQTLLKKIEEAKEGFVREMTDFIKQEEGHLNTRRITAETLKKELDTHLAMSDSVHENGSESEIFILNHVLKRTQTKASRTLNTLLENDYIVKLGLDINENILKIKTTDVALFSLHKTMELNTQTLNEDDTFKTSKNTANVNQVQPRPVRLELLTTRELVKTGVDKEQPFVSGLDFLPDGKIVAIDRSNCKCFILSGTLKMFPTRYKFKTCPRDVTSYSDNKIAVTVSTGYDRTICLLKVDSDNTITLMKTLPTSAHFETICSLNDRTFVVSSNYDKRPARMIDLDGNISDFENVKFSGKTYQFDESNCTYIPSRNCLVLSDRYAHIVYMYNTETGNACEIKDDRIREPKGACVGPNDSVFVCSENKNSVIQISPGGDILTSCDVYMKSPHTLTISRDGKRLAVTYNEDGQNKLNLFKIIQ